MKLKRFPGGLEWLRPEVEASPQPVRNLSLGGRCELP